MGNRILKLIFLLVLLPAIAVAQPTSGRFLSSSTDSIAATQSGAWTNACTQSGSWTVTANAGTNLNTSALALESGGNLATLTAKDFATSANQSTIIGHVDGIEGLLTTIDADTSSLAAEDFATQTTLAAINSKLVTGTDIGDVTINNAAGASAVNIQDGGNSITVDGTVAVSSVIAGTGTTSLGKAEDAAHASGHTGVMGLAVRSDTAASLAGTTGDYQPLITDSSGRVWVNNSGVTQPVSGTVTANLGTIADVATETTLASIKDTAGIKKITDALPAGSNTLGGVNLPQYTPVSGRLPVDGSGVVQPVSQSGAWTNACTQGTSPWVTKPLGYDNLPIYQYNYLGLVDLPVMLFIDPTTLNVSSVVNNGVVVTGDEAHDAVDDGNPNKIGYKARDYTPDTTDTYNGGQAAVAENDRVNGAGNLFGQNIEGVNSYFFTLDNVNATITSTTEVISTAKASWNYRFLNFRYDMTKNASPTDIVFNLHCSTDNGSTFALVQNDAWGDMRESAASVGSGIKKSYGAEIACSHIKIGATCTGCTGGGTNFVVANAQIYLRN